MYPTSTRIRFRMKGVKGARVCKHGSLWSNGYSAGNASTREYVRLSHCNIGSVLVRVDQEEQISCISYQSFVKFKVRVHFP
jgi:hypothetical protein